MAHVLSAHIPPEALEPTASVAAPCRGAVPWWRHAVAPWRGAVAWRASRSTRTTCRSPRIADVAWRRGVAQLERARPQTRHQSKTPLSFLHEASQRLKSKLVFTAREAAIAAAIAAAGRRHSCRLAPPWLPLA